MNEKKIREAIETIKSNYPTSGYYMLCEALDIAIEALEKQLPKKVKLEWTSVVSWMQKTVWKYGRYKNASLLGF